MASHNQELIGLNVNVDDVIYMPSLNAPKDRPHPFVYFVTIHNETNESVTIKGRKWIIEQSDGDKMIIEGEGVVQQFPVIAPTKNFNYNSYHVVSNNSKVTGSFFGETKNGQPIFARIPPFELVVPHWA